MLTIARSLMNNPSILLLDEPSEGLAPKVVEDLRDQVKLLKDSGLSIVLASTIDSPESFNNLTWSLKSSTTFGAKPSDGSSSNNMEGLFIRLRAIVSICCWPPLRTPPGRL